MFFLYKVLYRFKVTVYYGDNAVYRGKRLKVQKTTPSLAKCNASKNSTNPNT